MVLFETLISGQDTALTVTTATVNTLETDKMPYTPKLMILMIHQNWILPSLKLSRKEIIKRRIKGRNIRGINFIRIYFAIRTSNHMFGRAIYSKTRAISKFLKTTRVIYPQNFLNQTCGCWSITPNQKILFIETNKFLSAGN